MVLPFVKKEKSGVSVDIDDLSMKESETDLSIMFKNDLDEDLYLPQINKWKTIKIVNIMLCFLFFLVMLLLIIFQRKLF